MSLDEEVRTILKDFPCFTLHFERYKETHSLEYQDLIERDLQVICSKYSRPAYNAFYTAYHKLKEKDL